MRNTSNKKYDLLVLILVSLISSIIIYFKFIFGKYIYAYTDMGYDTVHAYLPQFEYLVQSIRNGKFFSFSFQLGMGTDTADYYANILNPFAWIPVLFGLIGGVEKTGFGLVYMQIAVGIAAGIVMYFYLQCFQLSRFAILLTAYIYSLSGYLFSAGQHYGFAVLAVLAPLLYLCIEQYLKNPKNWYWLVIICAYIGFRGVTAAFGLMLAGGIYVIVRCLMFESRMMVQKIQGIIKCACLMLVGLGCSMVGFLQRAYLIAYTNRIGNVSETRNIFEYISFINIKQLKTALLRLFSNNLSGTVSNWNGVVAHFSDYPYYLSVLFVFCFAQWLCFSIKNKKKWNCIISVILFGSIVNNFFPYLLNMFAYTQYRHMELLLPMFMIMMAIVITNLLSGDYYNRYVTYVVLAVSVIMVLCIRQNKGGAGERFTVINVLISCVLVAILLECINRESYKKRSIKLHVVQVALFVVLGTNLVLDHWESVNIDRTPMTKETLVSTYHSENIKKAIKIVNEREKDNVFRIDRTYLGDVADANWSLTLPTRSTDSYYSCLNGQLKKYGEHFSFFDSNYVNGNQMIYATYSYGTMFDAYMASVLGVKYLISAYQRDCADWELVEQLDDYRYLYQNKLAKTIGELYDTFVTEQEYEQLSEIEKSYVPEQTVVLEKEVSLKQAKIKYEQIDNAVNIQGVYSSNAQIDVVSGKLKGNSLDYTEVHIPVMNEKINKEKQQNIVQFNLKTTEDCVVDVVFNNGYGQDCMNVWNSQLQVNSGEERLFTRTMPQDTQEIVIVIQGTTEFEMEMPQIYNSNHQGFSNKELVVRNEDMGNKVLCQAECDKEKILFLAIPYSEGWKALVNGQETEIYRANYGFMAVKLSSGKNEIELVYNNPYMNIGCLLSITSLSLVFVIAFFSKIMNKG